jgi:hypothetical protein
MMKTDSHVIYSEKGEDMNLRETLYQNGRTLPVDHLIELDRAAITQ